MSYTAAMARPVRLPDAAILALIDELRSERTALTGMALRAELRRRHGTPGGVSRIYRLLASSRRAPPQPTPPPPLPAAALDTDTTRLQQKLAEALERADLAEHREQTHQDRWANEIAELRAQVAQLAGHARRNRQLENQVLSSARELAAAYRRISDLEEQLLRREAP
jgi:hypothetical protein